MEKIYLAPKSDWIRVDVADVVTDEIGLPDIGGDTGDGGLLSTPIGGGGFGGFGGFGVNEADGEEA